MPRPTKTTEQFIQESKNKFGATTFDYSKTIYKGSQSKVIIIFNNEEIEVIPNDHLKSEWGCRQRFDYLNIDSTTLAGFKQLCKLKNIKPMLYVIKCFDEHEVFYKIGRTSQASIAKRFSKSKSKRRMPYDYEIIYQHNGDAGLIFNLEEDLLIKLREYSYSPNKKFKGNNECVKVVNASIFKQEVTTLLTAYSTKSTAA